MRGVDDDWKRGEAQAQLDRNMPLRHVAVEMLAVGAESAVYGSDAAHSGVIDTLHGSDP